jgi:hypothetical protein
MSTIDPINVRSDTDSDARARHEYMEARLNELGERSVRALMALGLLRLSALLAWLGGTRLETKEDEAKKKAEAQH